MLCFPGRAIHMWVDGQLSAQAESAGITNITAPNMFIGSSGVAEANQVHYHN